MLEERKLLESRPSWHNGLPKIRLNINFTVITFLSSDLSWAKIPRGRILCICLCNDRKKLFQWWRSFCPDISSIVFRAERYNCSSVATAPELTPQKSAAAKCTLPFVNLFLQMKFCILQRHFFFLQVERQKALLRQQNQLCSDKTASWLCGCKFRNLRRCKNELWCQHFNSALVQLLRSCYAGANLWRYKHGRRYYCCKVYFAAPKLLSVFAAAKVG